MKSQNNIIDKEQFTYLISSVEKQLYNIAKTKLNNITDIEDVIQETIIKIYKNYESLKNPDCFRAWATKILINECNRFYQTKYKNDMLINRIIDRNNFNPQEPLFSKVESDASFENLLQNMNPEDREIFLFYYQYNYSTKEIASILDMNENTIKSKLKRNKEKLKELMKGRLSENEK